MIYLLLVYLSYPRLTKIILVNNNLLAAKKKTLHVDPALFMQT